MCQANKSTRGVYLAEVAGNQPLCDEHFLLRLSLKKFPNTRAGQFVQLLCRPPVAQVGMHEIEWPDGRPPKFTQGELTGKEPLLRRPLSLAGRKDCPDGSVELSIIYRAIGTGTSWLSGVNTGDKLSVLGPLGNGFDIFADKPLAAVVGGGVGIPPMIYLARTLAAAGRQTVSFNGARSINLLPITLVAAADIATTGQTTMCVQQFAEFGVPASIATDDGSAGFGGTVSEALHNWLNVHVEDADQLAVYCCGPEPLMRAVGEMCVSRKITCQLALERHMACGMGTCQSCVVKIRDHTEPGWSYKLCCSDGPVFNADTIVWD